MLKRVVIALLAVFVLVATASPNGINLSALQSRDIVTDCTYNCWRESQQESGCTGTTVEQTACMCNSLENHERFHACVVSLCHDLGDFNGLTPDMECVGYRHLAAHATTWGTGNPYAYQTTSIFWSKSTDLPKGSTTSMSFDSDDPEAGGTFSIDLPAPAPTTLKTSYKHAAMSPGQTQPPPPVAPGPYVSGSPVHKRDAQIAALSPYQTEPPSPPPKPHSQAPWQSQQITHHTVGACGMVAGMGCPAKDYETPKTESPDSAVTSAPKSTIIIATTTEYAPTLAPRSTLPSHSGGWINFCGVPGSACSDKEIENAEGIPSALTVPVPTTSPCSTSSLKIREPASTSFVPSLVRMCKSPNLVDCLHPLPPNPSDIDTQDATPPDMPTTMKRSWTHTSPVTINCQDGQCGHGLTIEDDGS